MPVLLYYGIISRALLKMSMSRKKIFACFDLKKKIQVKTGYDQTVLFFSNTEARKEET